MFSDDTVTHFFCDFRYLQAAPFDIDQQVLLILFCFFSLCFYYISIWVISIHVFSGFIISLVVENS